MAKKLWGGRFQKPLDKDTLDFTKSIAFDKRLALYDIEGSIAHAKMLGKCNIIPRKDSKILVKGLLSLRNKLNKIKFDDKEEDVHSAITNLLYKEVGRVTDKLHTSRSRNDQIALDVRMYCKVEIKDIIEEIQSLQRCFLAGAKKFKKSVTMPSYTHLKNAQCILLSHQLLAYIEMLERDKQRLQDSFERVDVMPLGSVAHRGTTLSIDRFYVAKLLGFSKVSDNSIDSVSDRDFVIEILSNLAILSMHLSRISEDFIIWSSDEFGFVEGSDAHYTGSSMMPNKKNPDPLELIRGYAGEMYGNLLSVLVMMKGLPLIYNRDMQLDKPPLFNSIDKIKDMLNILTKVLYGIKVNKERMVGVSQGNEYIYAADISEYLVTKGYPSRGAHDIVGRIVLYSIEKAILIKEISDKKLKEFAPELNRNVIKKLINPFESIKRVKSYGGTSPKSVELQIANWGRKLK